MPLVLVGGFLGSGKTTAIVKACQLLMEHGKSVAVITNDQGIQQVDGLFVSSLGINKLEVANGCFCCQYGEFDNHLNSLLSKSTDYIFAESVGSCTDLIATIVKPLHKFKPQLKVCTNVFVDAGLISLMLEGNNHFEDESIRYIFKKQLEEADILLVNKIDTIQAEQLLKVKAVMESDYRGKMIRYQNSKNPNAIQSWVNEINDFKIPPVRESLDIDYEKYGDGEQKLAWLDFGFQIETSLGNAHFIAREIIQTIFNEIMIKGLPIGHLKFFLRTNAWSEKISFTSGSTSASFKIRNEETNSIEIVMNARVQTQPDHLENIISRAFHSVSQLYSCRIVHGDKSSFKPGFPKPTHRLA